MRVFVLTNALDFGDAVSTHCLLLKRRCEELGIECSLHAPFSHPTLASEVSPMDIIGQAGSGDLLFHQFFNETKLMDYIEWFPGRRVMMYHNITPPDFFVRGSEVEESCSGGLRQAREIVSHYDLALGMSEFSRRDLEALGYRRTGAFPLLVDVDRLKSVPPNPMLLNGPVPSEPILLSVGRIAPNKRIQDLIEFAAAYREKHGSVCLMLVGNDNQHPDYRQSLLTRIKQLRLEPGKEVVFAGKVPEDILVAWYHRAGAYLCLSEHEGFCAPLLEAMAFDLPVFAALGGAIEETLGGAGVLFRHRNFPPMADAVHDVLTNPERRSEMIAGQRRRLLDFGPDRQRAAVQGLIDRIRPPAEVVPPPTFQPTVSVVINTYNRGKQLERCLESLEAQTYPHFEVVVVNGPSTDNTAAVLKRFEGRIRTVQTGSRVLSVSRNEGIAVSRGELVAFTDDDALPQPDWLKELVVPFLNPSVGGAGGLVYRMSGRDIEFRNGVLDRQGRVLWNQSRPGQHWNWDEGFLNTVSGNNCIFRRAALEKIGGFDERIEYYHDEADVVMRIQQAGYCTVHRPQAVVYHEAARSHNRSNPYLLNWFAITKNTVYVPLKNAPPEERAGLGKAIRAQLTEQHMKPMVEWLRHRYITPREFLRSEWACWQGMRTGYRLGIAGEPIQRNLPPVPATESILRYRSGKPDSLRVALLTQGLPWTGGGGIATYTLALARALRDAGCTVHVVSSGPAFVSEQKDGLWFHTAMPVRVGDNCQVPPHFSVTRKNLDYAEGVRHAVHHIAVHWGLDLVESPTWDSEGILIALEQRLPVVTRVHSPLFKVMQSQNWPDTEDMRLAASMEGLLLRHSCGITGSTNAILDLFDRRFSLPLERTARIPLGLDVPAIPSPPHRERRILFVGRLERRKGIHTLLEAIPSIAARFPDAVFDVVGPDSIRGPHDTETWAQGFRRLNPSLKDRVLFHGEVTDAQLPSFYANCDVFVAPSLYESFGLIYLEAMAQGKPVVGTMAGGIPEVVADGENGILIPTEDVPALERAVTAFLTDGQLARRMGEAGRRRYEKHFSAQVMGGRTLDFYRDRVREWAEQHELVWRGVAIELHRHQWTRIEWSALSHQNFVMAQAGTHGQVCFSPSMRLKPGSYRLECELVAYGQAVGDGWFGGIDIETTGLGVVAKKDFKAAQFRFEMGMVIDLFFTVTEESGMLQARVHTSGAVTMAVREMRIVRWTGVQRTVEAALEGTAHA